jgi:pyridoxal phosphate enzyme (YggS family)
MVEKTMTAKTNQPGLNYLILKEEVHQLATSSGRNPNEIKLVAVSKTHPVEAILEVYAAGCRAFGENRIAESMEKIPFCPLDIEWHLIGTLQGNKVNKAVQSFQFIESVDSPELARKISEASRKQGVTTPLLLQVNVSGEGSKHGLGPEGWRNHLEEVQNLGSIQLRGLMTIAPFTEDKNLIRSCFAQLKSLQREFQNKIDDGSLFDQLSMGMSHDYKIAIEEGATILRIGGALFGERISLK